MSDQSDEVLCKDTAFEKRELGKGIHAGLVSNQRAMKHRLWIKLFTGDGQVPESDKMLSAALKLRDMRAATTHRY